ncbi:MAG: GNAT family N-acetyltransferase [Polaribacter sp.]
MPLRFEDRMEIMTWRNEQMYHLRQAEPLTQESQDNYFRTTVASLFEQENPNQILFSYLKDGVCIGYGGLVHINRIDRHAEISFIMKTELEPVEFDLHWSNYLELIEKVGFEQLELHKLFVYAFDLRPHLYLSLQKSNYFRDATLKEHCYFNGKFLDVIIHSKLKS